MIGLMIGSIRVLWPWPGGTSTTTLGAPRAKWSCRSCWRWSGPARVIAVEHFSSRVGTMPESFD